MKKAVEYFLIYLALQFVSLTVVNGAVMLSGSVIGDNPIAETVCMNILNLLLVLAVFVMFVKAVKPAGAYLRTKPYVQLLWCLVIGVVTFVPSVYMQKMMPEVTDNMKELFESLVTTVPGVLSLVIISPVAEELVFRGAMIDPVLERHDNKWIAIIMSAFLFALAHFNPAQFVHAFLIGIILGWVYVRTKNVLPCVLIHVVSNALTLVFVNYNPEINLTAALMIFISVALLIISLRGLIKSTPQ